MTDWQWVAATVDGDPIGALTSASDRKVTFALLDACSATWKMDGRHPEAAMLGELTTDLLAYRDGELMFRGRVGSTSDDIDADRHTVQFAAVDYRGVLHRRKVYGEQTYTATDLADIAWDLIDTTQTDVILPGGPLGIIRGTNGYDGIGTARDHTVKDGAWVDEAIDDVANVWGGFNWSIDPRLAFQAWPWRGRTRTDGILLAPTGGNVTKLSRQIDTADYGNCWRASGTDGLIPAVRFAADLAQRPEGRIEGQDSSTEWTTQAMVDAAADEALSRHGALTPSFTATLQAGLWAPGVMDVGDTIPIRIRSGRLDVDTTDRVQALDISIDDDGNETVDVTWGQLRRDIFTVLRAQPARLERLERR